MRFRYSIFIYSFLTYTVADRLPGLEERFVLLSFTCDYVVSVKSW